MGTGHDHTHDVDLDHRWRLGAVLAITVVNFVVQLVGALVTRSLALIADAGHMLTDVMGLALALTAASLTLRAANQRRTWGFKRAEVLAAAAQAVVLGAVACYVIVEGIRRLIHP